MERNQQPDHINIVKRYQASAASKYFWYLKTQQSTAHLGWLKMYHSKNSLIVCITLQLPFSNLTFFYLLDLEISNLCLTKFQSFKRRFLRSNFMSKIKPRQFVGALRLAVQCCTAKQNSFQLRVRSNINFHRHMRHLIKSMSK